MKAAAITLSLCFAMATVAVWYTNRVPKKDWVPPIDVGSFKILCEKYADDQEQADAEYRGNAVRIDVWMGEVQKDGDGNEYWIYSELDPKRPGTKRELICCHAWSGHPLVEFSGGGYEHWEIVGTCIGKIRGVVTLRNCVMSGNGGNDW